MFDIKDKVNTIIKNREDIKLRKETQLKMLMSSSCPICGINNCWEQGSISPAHGAGGHLLYNGEYKVEAILCTNCGYLMSYISK